MSELPALSESSCANPYGPLTPKELFERAFNLLRENPKLFFGIVLIVIAAEIILGMVLAVSGAWTQHLAATQKLIGSAIVSLPLMLIGGALLYILTQIIQGALFFATDVKIRNGAITVEEACSLALRKTPQLVAVSLLIAFRIFGYLMLFAVGAGTVGLTSFALFGGFSSHAAFHFGEMRQLPLQITAGSILLLLLIAYIRIMFWLLSRYAVAVPACLAENISASNAIRRSVHLSAKSHGRIYAVILFVGFVSFAIFLSAVPLQFLEIYGAHARYGVGFATFSIFSLISAAIRFLAGAVLLAFIGIATTLCYFDLRVRKEGFSAGRRSVGRKPPVILLPVSAAQAEGLSDS